MKVLGINSGLGVSLYPFKKYLVGNIETRAIFHTAKNEQWNANFKGIPLHKNFIVDNNDEFANIDLIISSPDCGSGSIFRLSRAKKYGNHNNNKSLMDFFVSIKKIKPKFFYFENLQNLFKSFSKDEFIKKCEDYNLKEYLGSVSMFGNSQVTRKRLIIIGIRKDLPKKVSRKIKFPTEQPELKTSFELYGDLEIKPVSGDVREDLTDEISIYGGKKLTLRQIQKYWLKHKTRRRWVVKDRKFSRAPGVYRNLALDYPSTARKANRQYDHNGLQLTPRQLARIQGVPDDFKLYIGNPTKYWINKTRTLVTKTPPMEISYWLLSQLNKTKKLWQKK